MSFGNRYDLHIKQKGLCYYCGDKISIAKSTIDHILPLSKGGDNIESNRVLTCKRCNKMKADMNIVEFKCQIIKVYEYYIKKIT